MSGNHNGRMSFDTLRTFAPTDSNSRLELAKRQPKRRLPERVAQAVSSGFTLIELLLDYWYRHIGRCPESFFKRICRQFS